MAGEGEEDAFVLSSSQCRTRYYAADDGVHAKSWTGHLEIAAVGKAMTRSNVVCVLLDVEWKF